MSGLGLSGLLLLTGVLLAVGLAGVSALVWPRLRRRLRGVEPNTRAHLLTAWATAPLWGSALLVAVCMLPSVAALAWPALDHCLEHGDHHVHFCFVHGPGGHVGGWLAWLALAGLAAALVFRPTTEVIARVRAHRRLRQLERMARRDERSGTYVIDSEATLAFVAGVIRPRVFVSAPRMAQLEPTHRAVVLAHEAAHVERRDNLRKLIAALGSAVHGPRTRREMLRELDLACEQACDECASRTTGGRLAVATALLGIVRAQRQPQTLPAGTCGVESHLGLRVEALLASRRSHVDTPGWRRGAILATAAVGLVLAARPLHHALEALVDLLVVGHF